MRYRVQLDAEEARVVLDVLDDHLAIAQRMRCLQVVARVGHLGHQPTQPLVQLKFEQTAILGGTDVLALNQLEVMGNA